MIRNHPEDGCPVPPCPSPLASVVAPEAEISEGGSRSRAGVGLYTRDFYLGGTLIPPTDRSPENSSGCSPAPMTSAEMSDLFGNLRASLAGNLHPELMPMFSELRAVIDRNREAIKVGGTPFLAQDTFPQKIWRKFWGTSK